MSRGQTKGPFAHQPCCQTGPQSRWAQSSSQSSNLFLTVLETIVVLLLVHILHVDGLEQLRHSDGRHKGQALHHFDKIFKLAVDEDSYPLLRDVSPDGLFLMKVAAFHLNIRHIKCLI
jgi:hypothetical protein